MGKIDRLTVKQKKVYNFIKERLEKRKESPTLSEIGMFMGVISLRSVSQFLEALERKGLIRRSRYTQRGIEVVESSRHDDEVIPVPIFASVGCGQPSVIAEQTFGEYAMIAANLLKSEQDNIFIIRAIGNSMSEAGVKDGDLVLVEQTEDVVVNDIVIAIIDNNAVMKKISFANNAVILNPVSNDPIYHPIIMRRDFKVFGKLIQVLKTEFIDDYQVIPFE